MDRISAALLGQAYEVAGVGTYFIDLARDEIAMSRELCRLFRAGDAPLTMPLADYRRRFYHPDDLAPHSARAEAAYAAGEPFGIETRVIAGDGATIWVRSTSSRIVEPDQAPRIVGVIVDITDIREQAARVRESEVRFRAFADNALVGIYVHRGGAIEYANPALARMFGYPPGALVGASPYDLIHPDDRAAARAAIPRRLAGELDGVEVRGRGLRRDGSVIHFELQSTSVELDGRPAVIGNIKDVTARVLAEAQVRQVTERSLAGVYIAQDGAFVYANPAFARIAGVEPAALVGREVASLVHPDDRAVLAAAHGEARIVRPTGEARWIELLGSTMDYEGRPAIIGNTIDITARKAAEQELQHTARRWSAFLEHAPVAIGVQRDGVMVYANRRYRTLWRYASEADVVGSTVESLWSTHGQAIAARARQRTRSTPESEWFEATAVRRDGTTFPARAEVITVELPDGPASVAFMTDLSVQRETELQLQQAQKMEALGALAGGVAHDFNNLLAVIYGYAAMLGPELKPGDPMRDDIREIEQAAARASQLTKQLLAFSRRQVLQPRRVDLGDVVASASTMFRRLIGSRIELAVTRSADAEAFAYVDPGQIEQVLMNLVVNARDAMPGGGRIEIRVARVALDEAAAARTGVARPGNYVELAVADTGTGMPEAVRARIFEPFFTTKDTGRGTGLGLSTVLGIVQQSAGHIAVASEPGAGTTFTLWFPADDTVAPAAGGALDAPRAPALAGGETVLLVEDDDAVRRLAREVLARSGYRVLEARSGGDALVICERRAEPIHVVLSDVVMPLMSGDELVARVRAQYPAIRAVLMSGYPEHVDVSREIFVAKPFTAEALLAGLRRALG